MDGKVNERDPDIQSWKNEVEALLGDLEPEDRLMRPNLGNPEESQVLISPWAR